MEKKLLLKEEYEEMLQSIFPDIHPGDWEQREREEAEWVIETENKVKQRIVKPPADTKIRIMGLNEHTVVAYDDNDEAPLPISEAHFNVGARARINYCQTQKQCDDLLKGLIFLSKKGIYPECIKELGKCISQKRSELSTEADKKPMVAEEREQTPYLCMRTKIEVLAVEGPLCGTEKHIYTLSNDDDAWLDCGTILDEVPIASDVCTDRQHLLLVTHGGSLLSVLELPECKKYVYQFHVSLLDGDEITSARLLPHSRYILVTTPYRVMVIETETRDAKSFDIERETDVRITAADFTGAIVIMGTSHGEILLFDYKSGQLWDTHATLLQEPVLSILHNHHRIAITTPTAVMLLIRMTKVRKWLPVELPIMVPLRATIRGCMLTCVTAYGVTHLVPIRTILSDGDSPYPAQKTIDEKGAASMSWVGRRKIRTALRNGNILTLSI